LIRIVANYYTSLLHANGQATLSESRYASAAYPGNVTQITQ